MRNSLFLRVAPVVAIAAFAATASAQEIGTAGVSIAGEGTNRAALFTQSAYVAPQGSFGIGFQAAGRRASMDGDELTVSAMVLSGFYGLTSNLSIGAYVPYARISADIGGEEGSETGMADAGVFGRYQAFRSSTGMTKFAVGVEATLPTGDETFGSDDPAYALSGALSHRAGSWNLHIVPAVAIIKDLDPTMHFNVAAVRAMSPRMALSGEILTEFGGAVADTDDEGSKNIDLASGIRYRMTSSSAMDFGLSYNLSSNVDPRPTTLGAYLGFNWAF